MVEAVPAWDWLWMSWKTTAIRSMNAMVLKYFLMNAYWGTLKRFQE
jgi:hypothetical protein